MLTRLYEEGDQKVMTFTGWNERYCKHCNRLLHFLSFNVESVSDHIQDKTD